MWAATEAVESRTLTGFEVQEHWAAGVAAELGDYAGVVYRHAAQKPSASVDPREYAARLAFQAYVEGGNPATLLAAEEALADDPGNGHAHVVLGTVALTRHQWGPARKHSEDAARASPSHPTILATASSLIAYAGDWEAGVALLRESLRLNPLHPGFMHTLLAQDRLMVDDDAAALAEAGLSHAPGGIWGPLFRAMALAGLGHADQARHEMDAVLAIDPTSLDDQLATFTSYATLTHEQIGALLRHLEPFRTPSES